MTILISYTIVGDAKIIQYSNEEEIIIFNQSKGNANYQIDTKYADIREISPSFIVIYSEGM